MADRVTTGLYPFDPQGNNPANLITGERQTLQTPGIDDFYFIIPFAAPFFADSLKVYNDQNNQLYIEGVDYQTGHRFIEAMDSIGREICGSIRIMRRNITGIVRLEYRTLGGQWGFNDAAILAELSNRQFNPLIRSWGQIDTLPATFPPLPHDQVIDDLVGSDDLLGGLDSIAAAIEAAAAGSTDQHINDHNNPHQVTAAQVGLGSVANLPLADQPQSEAGVSNAAYMTPLRVSQAIAKLALLPLGTHTNDHNNPHATTKTQVGLGNVPNFTVATDQEAVDPSHNDRFMTPYTTALLLQSGNDGARLDALETMIEEHTADHNNPHQVTAAQVGAYTTADVDQMLAGFQADDTSRFAGLTDAEWRLTLPSFDDLQTTIEKIGSEYGVAAGNIAGVDTSIVNPEETRSPIACYAGSGRFVIVFDNGESYEIPQPALLSSETNLEPIRFSIRDNAAYVITDEGYITAVGSTIVPTPVAYLESNGVPPTNKPVAIYAQATFVYLLLNDGTVVKYTSSGVAQVATDVTLMYSAMYGPEKTILIKNSGAIVALGDNSYGSLMTTALTGLTDIVDLTITNDETYIRFTDNRLRAWSQVLTGGTFVITSIVLPIDQANDVLTISGLATHFGLLKVDGSVIMRGDNTYYQCNIDPGFGPYLEIAAGLNYTVTINETGEVHYWGIDDTNKFTIPATFEGA